MGSLLTNKKWQIVISICTAAYFFYVIIWCTPEEREFRKRIIEPVKSVWDFWRLDQNWALFSPVIRKINFHTVAILTFEDGTKTIFEMPRMNPLCMATRFRDEKWRKWSNDCLPWTEHKEFWPDIARFLGRRFYNPQNKPVYMSLNLWSTDIPTPESGHPRQPPPYHTSFNGIFEYRYTPEDFQ